MVRLKSDKKSKKEPKLDSESTQEEASITTSSRLHRIKKRNGLKRFFGVSLIILVLLVVGWFTTKLALNNWDISNAAIWKNLFSLDSSVELMGEESGRVNILLMGIPGGDADGPELSDTVMVASLDIENNTGLLFSLPRDLYVRIPGYGNSKLNAVYKIGNSQDDAGGSVATQVAGDILGLDIPYYFRINFAGFEQLIDELGGVTIEVEKDLYDKEYPTPSKGYETLDIKAGTYTMDGAMALKYARSRQSTSDFDRARRQQKVILAIREKAMSLDLLSEPSKALSIFDILNDTLETNLSIAEIRRLFELVKDFDPNLLDTKVFDDSPTGLLYGTRVDEMYVLRPVGDDYSVIADYVTKVISGQASLEELDSQVVTEPLKIEVLNGTIITGLAGRVATQLEAEGYEVVHVGNNLSRGFVKSIIYDMTDGDRSWEVRKLATDLNADVAEEEVTSSYGAQIRVVLGSEAN